LCAQRRPEFSPRRRSPDTQSWSTAAPPGLRRRAGLSIDDMARMQGATMLVGRVIHRLRCRLCGRAPVSCFIETRPQLAARGRMQRLWLIGPECGDHGRQRRK
jgi:hypothetical protein